MARKVLPIPNEPARGGYVARKVLPIPNEPACGGYVARKVLPIPNEPARGGYVARKNFPYPAATFSKHYKLTFLQLNYSIEGKRFCVK